ncbi:MAG: hypothetical protein AAGP08_09340 [Pseudomonadota bacterium]
MLDTQTLADPALLLRVLPRASLNGTEPVRFGGLPHLPADLEWPEGGYHVAELGHPDQL